MTKLTITVVNVMQQNISKNNSLPQFVVNSIPSCDYFQARFLSSDPHRKRKDQILPLNKNQCNTTLLWPFRAIKLHLKAAA